MSHMSALNSIRLVLHRFIFCIFAQTDWTLSFTQRACGCDKRVQMCTGLIHTCNGTMSYLNLQQQCNGHGRRVHTCIVTMTKEVLYQPNVQ